MGKKVILTKLLERWTDRGCLEVGTFEQSGAQWRGLWDREDLNYWLRGRQSISQQQLRRETDILLPNTQLPALPHTTCMDKPLIKFLHEDFPEIWLGRWCAPGVVSIFWMIGNSTFWSLLLYSLWKTLSDEPWTKSVRSLTHSRDMAGGIEYTWTGDKWPVSWGWSRMAACKQFSMFASKNVFTWAPDQVGWWMVCKQ